MARAYSGRFVGQPELIKQAYDDLFSTPPMLVALDTETISLKDRTVLGIGIATPLNDKFYFDIFEPGLPWHLILPSATRKIWHNASFDLSREVIGKFGADIDNIEDTAIITRLLNIDTELSAACFYTQTQTESAATVLARYDVKKMNDLPWDVVANKCMADAAVTMELFLAFYAKIDKKYYEMQRKMLSILLHMSHRGFGVDQELAGAIDRELENNVALYINTCKAAGFNPLSTQQVGIVLSDMGALYAGRGAPSTSSNILEEIAHPYAALTLLARRYSKLHGVVHGLANSPRAYSHFHMTAATGRITSRDIQMHNLPTGARPGDIIPKAGPVRRVFRPDSGWITKFDASQIELRILAYFSGDPVMQRALSVPIEDKAHDIHGTTQSALGLSSRVIAKNFNFGGFTYGGGAEVLSIATGIKDLQLIERYLYQLRNTYPVAAEWIQRQRYQGLRDMKVQTLFGRTLRLDQNLSAETASEKHIMNMAVNYPIQGSAYEIFALMLIELAKEVPIEDFILQVHDEGLLDGEYDIPVYKLAHISPLWTPIEVSHVKRWQ